MYAWLPEMYSEKLHAPCLTRVILDHVIRGFREKNPQSMAIALQCTKELVKSLEAQLAQIWLALYSLSAYLESTISWLKTLITSAVVVLTTILKSPFWL